MLGLRQISWATVSTLVTAIAVVGLPAAPASAQVPPAPNPPIAESCGIDVSLILDASGSIQSSNAVQAVRSAGDAFLTALADTNSTARVIDFGTVARQTAPPTVVTAGSLAPGGVFRNALNAYYNPKPPIIAPVKSYLFNGGNPLSASSYTQKNDPQYTNWDQALDVAGQVTSELIVFVTDGDPTAFDFTEPGDPFNPSQRPPNVAYRTDRNSAAEEITLDRAVVEANQAKANGARVLAIGVGNAVTGNPESAARLVAVSGPDIARTAAEFDIATTDVALVADFDALAQALRDVVVQLCSPSLTITKLAQSPSEATFAPAPGWDVTVAPTVAGGTFRWILPDTVPAVSKTQPTNANGVAQFQWEPNPATAGSSAIVSEGVQPGYTPVDYRCENRNPDGSVAVTQGPLTGAPPTFTIPVGPEQIVTCTLRNAFNYAPAIAVTKVNAPTEVRGDLDPPATVTSSYAVTNPGNTPLSNVTLVDDQCGPVQPVTSQPGVNIGDVNANNRLDVPETWQFTCVRDIQESLVTAPVFITNTVEAVGVDPEGTVVTATATDDIEVITPAIDLEKLVTAPGGTPQQAVVVTAGTTVTYTYVVTNLGNVALSPVVLSDNQPPCATPTFTGGDNGDGALDLTETWTYECIATIQRTTVNVATVTGTPVRPSPDPGPPVTSTDAAFVRTVEPGLILTKVVDQPLVFPGTTVTYTYTAENTGTANLQNPADPPGAPSIPPAPWVTDNECAPVTYVSGDANNDGLLNAGVVGPGETWTFTCTTPIDEDTLNIATIRAVTVAPNPISLIRAATALVEVREPDISITKTALRGVVLDPAATPVAGPDVPTPRLAEYLYEVTNTGDLPLIDVIPRLSDNKCDPLVQTNADTRTVGALDVGETWEFRCEVELTKADGFPPDQPISSLVTNVATVAGTPVLDGVPNTGFDVSAADQAQVLVIEPSFTLSKSAAPTLVRPGSDVTYTYAVQNTGDVGLDPISFEDDLCAPVTYVSGDLTGNGLIDGANSGGGGETWILTCTTTVGFPDPLDPVTNTATASFLDPLGNTYTTTAQATVELFSPGIDLTKTVSSELVPNGSTVTYEFVVTNVGISPVDANDVLADITLVDVSLPPTPSCSSPTFVGGDTNGDDLLDFDETWTYECSAVITADTVNEAVVTGTDIQGGLVIAADAAFTGPFNPAIEVTKTATPTSILGNGGPVVYTYAVRNTGDVPLADVAERIEDDTCSPAAYVTGDVDGDGLLDTIDDIFEQAEDETWIFTCTTDVTEDTVNTVVVEGTPVEPDGTPLCPSTPCDVTDSAVASVTIVAPASITIVKSASPATSTTFGFTGSLGDFGLVGDGSAQSRRTFDGLAPGTYAVQEVLPSGWELSGVVCTDPTSDSRVDRGTRAASVAVGPGESVTCTFTNVAADVAGSGIAATGFAAGHLFRIAIVLILGGAVLVRGTDRRRRPLRYEPQ